MKIYTTWTDEFEAFQKFFAGHEVNMLPDDYLELQVDLLLFPGGDDVHPKRYGAMLPSNSIYRNWVNLERDDREFGIMKDVMRGRFKPKKILGVCRGMQFLNVALGGNLIYDIPSRYGKPHPNAHPITWQHETVFSPIKTVNSLHHQGLYRLGDYYTPVILGTEPTTGIIEAVLWGQQVLGMQFHPELWRNQEEMKLLSEGIVKWVEGENILTKPLPEEPPRRGLKKGGWTISFNTTWENTPPEPEPDEEPDFDDFDSDEDEEDDE